MKLAAGHNRLDHKTSAAACSEINVMKEIKSNYMSNKKRHAGGGVKSNNTVEVESDLLCTDYASDCKKHAIIMRNKDFVEGNPFVWVEKNGKFFLEITEFK